MKNKVATVFTVPLSMAERLALLGLLPRHASLATIKLVEGLRQMILPNEGEFEGLPGYEVQADGATTWDAKIEEPRQFSFSPHALKLIVGKLEVLDKEEQLTLAHLSLWQKFVERDEPAEERA